MLATSRDSESWRRRAAIASSWEWFSTMAEGRSPSATVLLLRQCLVCGLDSIFAVFRRRGRGCNTSLHTRSDDGLDFQAICRLYKEPTSEKSHWIENAAFWKITALVTH